MLECLNARLILAHLSQILIVNFMDIVTLVFIVALIHLLKADIKSFLLLQTAAIFFLFNLYLKQGIGSVYIMVDFIYKEYPELSGTRA